MRHRPEEGRMGFHPHMGTRPEMRLENGNLGFSKGNDSVRREPNGVQNSWYKSARNIGDCFVVAGKYVSGEGIKNPNLTLVHARIRPRMGKMKNIVYWHAWVEDGDKILDFSNGKTGEQAEYEKPFYYLLADPQEIRKYSFSETLKMTTEHGNWGPWD